MYEAMMIAATGLKNQQRRLDTIADNVANSNTVAFKTARLDFKDALYTAGLVPGPPYSPDGNQQKGHGVMLSSISKEFTQGSLTQTGDMLDLALEGDGFFEVSNPAGELFYTRAGNFYLSEDDSAIVNSNGYFLQNANGMPLGVPDGTTKIDVSESGLITFYNADSPIMTDQIAVYSFNIKTGLSYAGNSNYQITEVSGERVPLLQPQIRQGFLESSNINMSSEFTRLIRTQRAFSLAGRALTTADDMEGIANNMRK